jgi:glycosyltransferase involved in cell wall biosynthesis
MSTHSHIEEKEIPLSSTHDISKLFSYPIDMQLLLDQEQYKLDDAGVPLHVNPRGYHPTIIAQCALVQWNQYLTSHCQSYRDIFLMQAQWFVENEIRLVEGASGWPITLPHPDVYGEGTWLSAVTQGLAISVLLRAYQLTREKSFLDLAHRAVRTFEQDILDGGVCAPVGDNGVFFEEIAVYPALHTFSGFILALLGLYDYVTFTDNVQIRALIQRSIATMHLLLGEFDTGFWTRIDLLHRHVASPTQLSLQITLLEAITAYSGCEHCSMLVSRWRSYQCRLIPRLRYLISRCLSSSGSVILNQLRSRLFPASQASQTLRVCVPITAFPITGGMRTVVRKIAEATADTWHLEYLTQYIGPETENFTIHQFGSARCYPWDFPHVWFYVFAGLRKLISLLRDGSDYHVILPQDGLFTAAFAGLVGKLVGRHVVCIDHGNLVALNSHLYRRERLKALHTRPGVHRAIKHFLFTLYWPSLYVMGWLAGHLVDHFCVPGVTGDGVEEICKCFGVGPGRLTRFVNAVNIDRYVILDAAKKAEEREKRGISADAIVITTICRLAPEKGVDIALKSIAHALSILSPDLCTRLRFILAGDGPLRQQLEEDIDKLNLTQTCLLLGAVPPEEVLPLHSVSDIYLYTGTRGGGYSLVMLEAMASGCTVLASDVPLANECMLADGRGWIVPAQDVEQTGLALARLISDSELCHQMGQRAREYVASHNTNAIFKRIWMRATYWSELSTVLKNRDEGSEQEEGYPTSFDFKDGEF